MARLGALALSAAVVTGLGMAATGCGAAYYGAGIGIFLSLEKTKTIDTSFPDAKPTAPVAPGFATLRLAGGTLSVTRAAGGGFVGPGSGAAQQVDGAEVLDVVFPAGFGEARSDRDAGTTLANGDTLIVRINGDDSQLLTFSGTVTLVTGAEVAAAIEAAVQNLAGVPVQPGVPAEAYTLFSGSYDEATGSYRFVSGAPGDESAVEFDTAPRPGTTFSDQALTAASTATAVRLGLGQDHGGIETTGAPVGVTLLNRGTDSIPAGTAVDLYLSHDKLLDPTEDVLFDRISTDRVVEVGQVRTFYLESGNTLPIPLIAEDFTPGHYYVLFDVAPSGGEEITDNNLTWSPLPLELYDEAAAGVGSLDYAITSTRSPIAAVLGNQFSTTLTVSNFGAAVTSPGTLDLDLVLSSDSVFDDPAKYQDSAGVVPGVRVNPRDPNRAITIALTPTGGTAEFSTTLSGNTGTLSFGTLFASTAPVQSLVQALNDTGLVDAYHDGVGDPYVGTLGALFAASGTGDRVAKDVFVTSRTVTFPTSVRPQFKRTYGLSASLRQGAILPALLPTKLYPLYRVTPEVGTLVVENSANNVRQATNFVRLYDRATATFDSETGLFVPTVSSDDFNRVQAVADRPASGGIRQGQQRVLSFEVPAAGLGTDESQLLLVLYSAGFDAHLDLLSSTGELVAQSDDSNLDNASVIYTPVFANSGSRTFYAVISPARIDESDLSGAGEQFTLTISVKRRLSTDIGLIQGVPVQAISRAVPQRYGDGASSLLRNDILVPFSMANGKGEVMFVLPARARVRARSRPVFTVGVDTEFTWFSGANDAEPVEFRTELVAAGNATVYRPIYGGADTYHELDPGVYTIAFNSKSGAADTQVLRLELDTQFIPPTD